MPFSDPFLADVFTFFFFSSKLPISSHLYFSLWLRKTLHLSPICSIRSEIIHSVIYSLSKNNKKVENWHFVKHLETSCWEKMRNFSYLRIIIIFFFCISWSFSRKYIHQKLWSSMLCRCKKTNLLKLCFIIFYELLLVSFVVATNLNHWLIERAF